MCVRFDECGKFMAALAIANNDGKIDQDPQGRHWFSLTNLQHIEFMRSLDLIFAF
jgi:hypothetical protein